MSSFCCAIAIVFYGGLAIDVSAAFQKQNVCRLSSGILLQLTWHEAISLCAPAATTAAVATQIYAQFTTLIHASCHIIKIHVTQVDQSEMKKRTEYRHSWVSRLSPKSHFRHRTNAHTSSTVCWLIQWHVSYHTRKKTTTTTATPLKGMMHESGIMTFTNPTN